MHRGYIKLYRKMLESPIFANSELFYLWSYCLMRANWKDKKWLLPGTHGEIIITRGSFITGRETLKSELYPERDNEGNKIRRTVKTPNARTIWRWMHSLEQMQCVKLENMSNRCTMVSVCNYSTYQDVPDESCPTDVQPVSSSCPTGVQPVSTTKELKELKEVYKAPSEFKAFAKPSIEEISAYCTERGNLVNPQDWFDHYTSNGWMVGKNKMKDWKASVRTWERNGFRDQRPTPEPAQQKIKYLDLTPEELAAQNGT